MTINGKHTIAEIRDLARTVEFRIKATNALIAEKNFDPQAFTPGHPGITAATVTGWETWVTRWRKASDSVLPLVTALSLSNPLIPADIMAAEDQWRILINAITAGSCTEKTVFCDVGPYGPGDMTFNINAVEKDAQGRIDERDAPQPTAGDPDLAAFQKLDATIRASEEAAAAAAAAAAAQTKQAAFKVPWYVWAGGVVVVGGVASLYAAPLVAMLPPLPRRR